MDACDMMCAGTSGHEVCGGLDTITAYEIEGYTTTPEYIGCYEDNAYRAMQGELKYVTGDMTNEVSVRVAFVQTLLQSQQYPYTNGFKTWGNPIGLFFL